MGKVNNLMKEIYPCTLLVDRYNGTYSGGLYTAWNLNSNEIPSDIYADDVTCSKFWSEHKEQNMIGIGDTPYEALKSLAIKLNKTKNDLEELKEIKDELRNSNLY